MCVTPQAECLSLHGDLFRDNQEFSRVAADGGLFHLRPVKKFPDGQLEEPGVFQVVHVRAVLEHHHGGSGDAGGEMSHGCGRGLVEFAAGEQGGDGDQVQFVREVEVPEPPGDREFARPPHQAVHLGVHMSEGLPDAFGPGGQSADVEPVVLVHGLLVGLAGKVPRGLGRLHGGPRGRGHSFQPRPLVRDPSGRGEERGGEDQASDPRSSGLDHVCCAHRSAPGLPEQVDLAELQPLAHGGQLGHRPFNGPLRGVAGMGGIAAIQLVVENHRPFVGQRGQVGQVFVGGSGGRRGPPAAERLWPPD